MIATLNGNLVVRFTDYSTHEPFFSFLGDGETEHTARTLINYSKANGMPAELRLVPEISTQGIRPSVLTIQEDRDNFDYVYSISKLAVLSGSEYLTRRGKSNKFQRENPGAIVEAIDFADAEAQRSILAITEIWERNKIDERKSYEIEHEREALKRLCATADSHHLVATAIFLNRNMIAFSIEEILSNSYCICHFWKADTLHTGIFDFLMQKKAQHLENQGVALINYEQDLGVPNLRAAKLGFRPSTYLKKYIIDMNSA